MITTKSVGIGAEIANPKPVRQFNWCGQPMKEGDSYWGESEPQQAVVSDTPKPRAKRVKRSWTATQIEAMRARMAHARAAAKAKRSETINQIESEG
jgi:hypothetical protein